MKKVNIKKFLIFIVSSLFLCLMLTGCLNSNNQSEAESNTSVSTPSENIYSEPEVSVKPLNAFLTGTKYGGVDISGISYNDALELMEEHINVYREELDKLEVTVKAEDGTICVIKGSDVNFTDKTETKLAEIIVNDLKGEHELSLIFDSEIIKEKLNEVFAEFDIEPKDAVITGVQDGKVLYESAVEGKLINIEKTSELVIDQLLKLDKKEIAPEYDLVVPELSNEIIEQYSIIGSFSTNINSSQSESIYNMKLAMRILDGRTIMPGESLSFMKYMKLADSYGGWQSGNVIIGGILVPASGGGMCQASTTIYGVALDSGMTILDRDNHGIPSSYVKLGLDAMVSDGYSDLIFRNDLDYPVYLDTSYGSRVLYANIYGIKPDWWDSISCDAWVTETIPAPDGVKFIVNKDLEEGEFSLENNAAKGYRTAAQRYYYKDGELVKVENLTASYYPARQKTYTIGKNTDTTTLEDGTEKREEGKIEPTPSVSPSPSPEASVSPSVSPSTSPSSSPSVSPSTSPSTSPSASPEASVSPSVSPSASPEVSESPTVSPTPSSEPTPSASPTSPVSPDHGTESSES